MPFGDIPVDAAYELTLRELAARHAERAAQVRANQPAYTPELDFRIKGSAGPALYRMIKFIWTHPGARTDEVAKHCAIGNVSDVIHSDGGRAALSELGLMIRCETEKSRNRYYQKTVIGRWWLTITDYGALYHGKLAANDLTEPRIAEGA